MDYIHDTEQSVSDLQPAILLLSLRVFLKDRAFYTKRVIYERRGKRVQYKIGVHAPAGSSRELETHGRSWSNE